MERLNRKIKRIAILEARLAVLKTELQSELEQLNNSNDMTMNYGSKTLSPVQTEVEDWGDCVRTSEIISEEDWESEANRQPFTLGGTFCKTRKSTNWENRCPVCFSKNCGHKVNRCLFREAATQ